MIVIDNIKYACQKCIKGHRSSRCDHTERHLLIVRKKGRPISQCDSCREQRKKRQIHQKCACTASDKYLKLGNTHHIMSIESLLL
ncbi:copper fist DNA binding domain-containing protein [Thamnidium elegans]|nr:copper fist DNA binding domain-containing protein [Thamnidium elegans]